MATGADDRYWEQRRLPSVLKHDLIRRYLPVFAGKTGSKAGGLIYLDGYAGRGRYENGTPASAELILRIAENQAKLGISYQLFFYEPDPESFQVLEGVADEYTGRGVRVHVEPAEVISGIDDVLAAASGWPLFLFLDPCGLGVPFSVLTQTLVGPRARRWPPTEVLLNFSLEAVRRIGGHVTSATPDPKTMARLDQALGGQWWREYMASGVTDEAVAAVVAGFKDRLSQAARMDVFAVPVLRAAGHKPVYHLVFGTRNPLGLWHFGDAAARATQLWWEELTAQEDAKTAAAGQLSLFDEPLTRGPKLEDVEARAVPVITENIAGLLAQHGSFRVGDFPAEVFGIYLGRVRETTVRAAIKQMHAAGRTASTGTGNRIENLTVSPPK